MRTALPRLSTASRTTRGAALVGCLGYVLVVLSTLMWAYGLANVLYALVSVQIGPFLWWALLGGALVGTVLGVSTIRYDLVSPLLSVAVVYGVATYQMWQAIRSPNPLQPGTPLDIYLVSWPLILVLALGSGFVERRLRDRRSSSENSEPS